MSKTNPVIPADDDGPAETAAPAEITADPADEIGARLASARLSRGIKVTALARLVGVSPSLISQIERGQSRPSVSTLFALAEALDVPVDAFFRDGDASRRGARARGQRVGDAPRRDASTATSSGATSARRSTSRAACAGSG